MKNEGEQITVNKKINIIIFGIILLFFASAKLLLPSHTLIKQVVMQMPVYYMPETNAIMHESIKKNICGHTIYSVCLSPLIEEYSYVKSITVRAQNREHAFVRVEGYDPCAILNNDFVIFENGAVTSTTYFLTEALSRLVRVYASRDIVQSDRCKLASLIERHSGQDVLIDYLVWHDSTNIDVLIKDDSGCYKITINQMINPDQHTLARRLFEYMQKKMPIHQKERIYVADLRFDNQIVLYPETGEKNEGHVLFS